MSELPLWAIGSDLPVKVLATIGAFTLGGFLGGWLVGLVAKFSFRQTLPNWLAWTMRSLSGLIFAWIVWNSLSGKGPFGGLGNWLFGDGPGQETNYVGDERVKDKTPAGSKSGKGDKTVDPPKDKDQDKSKTDGPGIGSGEAIRVEVLGNGPLEKLAREGKPNYEKRYRLADAPTALRTLEEIKTLISQRREKTPSLRKLIVIVYSDSPDKDSGSVEGLLRWAKDLDPIGGPLEVEYTEPGRRAPLN